MSCVSQNKIHESLLGSKGLNSQVMGQLGNTVLTGHYRWPIILEYSGTYNSCRIEISAKLMYVQSCVQIKFLFYSRLQNIALKMLFTLYFLG